MEIIEIVAIILVIAVVAFCVKSYFFATSEIFYDTYMKGSRIMVDDIDHYPCLFLFITNKKNNELVAGVFDKDFHDYVGNPSRQELLDQLNLPNVYNFDEMNEDEFVQKFGDKLIENNKNPKEVYYHYRMFSIGQLYGYDLDISKDEFINRFGDDIKEVGLNSSDVYDQLQSQMKNT